MAVNSSPATSSAPGSGPSRRRKRSAWRSSAGRWPWCEAAARDDPYDSIKLFTRVMEMVRKDYVDGEKLTYQDLIYGALKGMLSTLDPHSEFMEPQKFDELKKDTEGQFGGVGIVISVKDN